MNNKRAMGDRVLVVVISVLFAVNALANAQIVKKGRITAFYAGVDSQQKNFAYAGTVVTAMPLRLSSKRPMMDMATRLAYSGNSGASSGYSGTGRGHSMTLGRVSISEKQPSAPVVTSLEFGTSSQPFNTHRVDNRRVRNHVSRYRPYRAAGQLYFKIGADSYLCSAALIKRGLLVTAAHCVAEFGASNYYSDWQFVPASYDGQAPYGVWNAAAGYVVSSYFDGTDSCTTRGVTCANDVGVLAVTPQAGAYPGDAVGWFRYGWNGKGFTDNGLALVSQLGYSVSHDEGLKMQQSDSQAFVDASMSNNIVWGGRQAGGSSGGPVIVNLGMVAKLSDGVEMGEAALRNMVVGVVSWGYVDQAIKQQGASPFTSENIVTLVRKACKDFPEACSSAKAK